LKEDQLSPEDLEQLRSFTPGYDNPAELPATIEDAFKGLDKAETPNDNMESFQV